MPLSTLEGDRYQRSPLWRDIPRYFWSLAVSHRRIADILLMAQEERKSDKARQAEAAEDLQNEFCEFLKHLHTPAEETDHTGPLYRRNGRKFSKLSPEPKPSTQTETVLQQKPRIVSSKPPIGKH